MQPFNWVWKCDVKKFFDSVDQGTLLKILSLRIKDNTTLNLLKEVIGSFTTVSGGRVGGREAIAYRAPPGWSGMPIGNLTSQIFANIYLNELDRFAKHTLKIKAYLRYGDDFIFIEADVEKLKLFRAQTIGFLQNELKLRVNPKCDKIIKPGYGLKFLGIKFWPSGRTLTRRNMLRTTGKLASNNVASYNALIRKHGNNKQLKRFNWQVCEKLLEGLF